MEVVAVVLLVVVFTLVHVAAVSYSTRLAPDLASRRVRQFEKFCDCCRYCGVHWQLLLLLQRSCTHFGSFLVAASAFFCSAFNLIAFDLSFAQCSRVYIITIPSTIYTVNLVGTIYSHRLYSAHLNSESALLCSVYGCCMLVSMGYDIDVAVAAGQAPASNST